jgi:hypothetical protein
MVTGISNNDLDETVIQSTCYGCYVTYGFLATTLLSNQSFYAFDNTFFAFFITVILNRDTFFSITSSIYYLYV